MLLFSPWEIQEMIVEMFGWGFQDRRIEELNDCFGRRERGTFRKRLGDDIVKAWQAGRDQVPEVLASRHAIAQSLAFSEGKMGLLSRPGLGAGTPHRTVSMQSTRLRS